MDMKSLKDVLDEVVKNQELVTISYKEAIHQVQNEIQEAVNKIQLADDQPSFDHESVFTDLKKKLETIWPQEQLEESRNELHNSFSRYQELLGKLFDNDVSKAYAGDDFDYKTINQIIISSLYHDGLFHVADVFLQESQATDNVSLRTQFTRMHYIIKALRARELEPALTWVSVNREKLNLIGPKHVFDLHRFQYLEIVQKGNKSDAMNYFNAYLFSSDRSIDVKELMDSLLWCGKLETSPYSELLSPHKWDDLVKELCQQFCNLIRVSLKNPLSVTLEAGAQALPDGAMEIELGNEFQFHPVFTCPVCYEESSVANPPVMLGCGHVFCSNTISALIESQNAEDVLKCPTCRLDSETVQNIDFLNAGVFYSCLGRA